MTRPEQPSPAYYQMPAQVRTIIDSAVASAKGRPWIMAYEAARSFYKMGSAAIQAGPEPSDHEMANAEAFTRGLVTALLERMGARSRTCSDPFQAAVYRHSDRKDFRKTAKKYIARIGGEEAHRQAMEKWASENPDAADEAPGALPIQSGEIPSEGPPGTLEQFLEVWTQRAREEVEKTGNLEPTTIGQLPDGSEVFFRTKPFDGQGAKQAFHTMTQSQLKERGATRLCTMNEVWMAEGNTGIRASKAENRQEAIMVVATDGAESIVSYSVIERDWETGQVSLGPSEKGTSTPDESLGF